MTTAEKLVDAIEAFVYEKITYERRIVDDPECICLKCFKRRFVTEPHPLDIPACLLLTAEQRCAGWIPKPSGSTVHQSSEKAAKKAEGLAKLAQWKQDNPELVEAQKHRL
jgi:hypothetical protein